MTCIRRSRGIPSMPPTPDAARDAAGTVRWRRHQLMDVGLDELSAHRLATRVDLDLHAVLTLADTVSAGSAGLLAQVDPLYRNSPHV